METNVTLSIYILLFELQSKCNTKVILVINLFINPLGIYLYDTNDFDETICIYRVNSEDEQYDKKRKCSSTK